MTAKDAIDMLEDLKTHPAWIKMQSAKEAIDLAIKTLKERPQGKWKEDELHNVVCSNCGGIRRDNRVDYINYCNKCGAKMVKGENNV